MLFCVLRATHPLSELAKRGSLFDHLHKKKKHPGREQTLLWAEQIAKGIDR